MCIRDSIGSVERDVHAGRPRVARTVLPEGAQEPERRQRGREERGGGPPDLLQRLVEVVLDLGCVLGREPALAEREQLKPGGGEGLSCAVVQLAGDPAALLVLERR